MKKSLKNSRGITLVALVITIILLLILAEIAINGLIRENGLITRAKQAILDTKKTRYFEEINLEITDEILERHTVEKEEAFIVSIRNRLLTQDENRKKDWITSVIICDENFQEQQNIYDNTLLIVTTKEEYEIYVDVNNSLLTAKIRDSFEKVGEIFTVVYDANGGQGKVEEQSQKKGFKVSVRKNEFTKNNYSFTEWNTEADGSGQNYLEGYQLTVNENITLYAQWSHNTVKLNYDANGGNGTMQEITPDIGSTVQLAKNTFTKTGYVFDKWTTNADGTGESYNDEAQITVNSDTTLYAQWKQLVTKTYLINNGIDQASLTGGWTHRNWTLDSNRPTITGSLTQNTGSLRFINAGTCKSTICTTINTINLKDKNTLVINYDSAKISGYVGIGIYSSQSQEVKFKHICTPWSSYSLVSYGAGTVTLDISDCDGTYYIGIRQVIEAPRAAQYIDVTQIYIE